MWFDFAPRALSELYRSVTRARGVLYDRGILRSYRSSLPVVSIGNLTAGGNGKTPLCLYVVRELSSRGFRPVVLSRGYGGTEKGPHRVLENDDPVRVGDEPLMLARSAKVPVYVARRRAAGARKIERDKAGDVIVLDDGFQHRALARDIDIVSIFVGTTEAVERFVAGEMLPAGRFREDRDEGLARTDIVVLNERRILGSRETLAAPDPRVLALVPPRAKVFRSYYTAVGVRILGGSRELPPGPIAAFAGLAQPEGFYRSLVELGYTLVAQVDFPDHHPFTTSDVRTLRERFPGYPLVCTEKDAVKLMSIGVEDCWCLEVSSKVVPSDAFMVQIVRSIASRQK